MAINLTVLAMMFNEARSAEVYTIHASYLLPFSFSLTDSPKEKTSPEAGIKLNVDCTCTTAGNLETNVTYSIQFILSKSRKVKKIWSMEVCNIANRALPGARYLEGETTTEFRGMDSYGDVFWQR